MYIDKSNRLIIPQQLQASIFKIITIQKNIRYNKSKNYNDKLMASKMLQNVWRECKRSIFAIVRCTV